MSPASVPRLLTCSSLTSLLPHSSPHAAVRDYCSHEKKSYICSSHSSALSLFRRQHQAAYLLLPGPHPVTPYHPVRCTWLALGVGQPRLPGSACVLSAAGLVPAALTPVHSVPRREAHLYSRKVKVNFFFCSGIMLRNNMYTFPVHV